MYFFNSVFLQSLTFNDLLKYLINVIFTFIFSGYIFFIYKKVQKGVSYDRNFNITLVMLSFLSSIIMGAVQNNISLAIGALGSFALVRFRTNIKNQRDIGFIFWALSIGMLSGMGYYVYSFIVCIAISLFLIFSNKNKVNSSNLLLIIRGYESDLIKINNVVSDLSKGCSLKSKNVGKENFEFVYEIKSDPTLEDCIIETLMELDGVDSVSLLASNSQI